MNGARGFSLIEVLVAFTILALVLSVLFEIFSSGLKRTRLAEEYTHAALLAQSQLARLGVEAPIAPGEQGGRIDDTYRWRALAEPYDEDLQGAQRALPIRPYRITLEIRWGAAGAEHVVPLHTVRLVREP